MRVRSLFFASYRQAAGTEQLLVELPDGSRITDLVGRLRASIPGAAALPVEPVVALNMVYAPLSASLRDGDEVAFIPPVAGG